MSEAATQESASGPTTVVRDEHATDEHDAAFYADAAEAAASTGDNKSAADANYAVNGAALRDAATDADAAADAASGADAEPRQRSFFEALGANVMLLWLRVGEPYVRGAAIGLGLVLVHYVFARHLLRVRR